MNSIVNKEQWLEERRVLLGKEKELAHLREEVAEARRGLPWQKVKEGYLFEDNKGIVSLADLFGDKSQLIIVHYMFGPGWEQGCKVCSFWADQYDAMRPHLAARDVSLVAVSRAPWQDINPFKQRMGWQFPWFSSASGSFNSDFQVSFPGQEKGQYNYRETQVMEENPGMSVFTKSDDGEIFHTYSTYSRGLDPMNAAYQMLDLVPKGRDEANLPFPMAWVQFHDEYE